MKKATEIREAFLTYFEEKKHRRVPSSSLVPAHDDPSVLLTSAGMQQFKSYFLGIKDAEKDFGSKALTSVQRCFRTADLDSVGDESHLTFFEMLGNFSVNDYFKEEAIDFAWEFMTKIMKLPKERFWATIFEGDANAPRDEVAEKAWLKHLPKKRILAFGRAENWWGPTGDSGPCGPSSELHYDLTGRVVDEKKDDGPNSDTGRFLELWNLVFTEYEQDTKGVFTEMKTKNIDTGMGLERLVMVMQGKNSVYETDLYHTLHGAIHKHETFEGLSHAEKETSERIIMDHMRGTVFLLADGVDFSNKDQGYILRRIYRRALDQCDNATQTIPALFREVFATYSEVYPHLKNTQRNVFERAKQELAAYTKILNTDIEKLLRKLDSAEGVPAAIEGHHEPAPRKLTPEKVFQLYTTYGFSLERLTRKGYIFDMSAVQKLVDEHKEISKKGQEKKFGGHGLHGGFSLDDRSKEDVWRITRQHTATHLLHQALRAILGDHVRQSGSDITPERLRFDFTHPKKLTDEERQQVESLVNEKIQEDLEVQKETLETEKALASGALSFFREKYGETSSVYSIGDFSKELCGGPHVAHTAQIGKFVLLSEKSNAAGIRRIKAIVEDTIESAIPEDLPT
ncbi:MAG: alanine--tRNA ligase [Patescibacteria group bacterium]|jgi:alanyl-tRNA synthetase